MLIPKDSPVRIPVSVIVPVRNEARNLPRCLESLSGFSEIYVVDSQSADATVQIASSYGAKIVQFHYQGGWPKKRQWALDTLSFSNEWILLLDADEALTLKLADEIRQAIGDNEISGYYIALQMYFLGRMLKHGGARFEKLSLFRLGKAHFECRLREQDISMSDTEVHEHVVVDGRTARLRNPLAHHNVESLSRYIQKHDEYSNWEAKVWVDGEACSEIPASFAGTQAQRRRWLRKKLFNLPGSPILFFLYRYILRLGFLDGVPGLIYCGFQGVQFFQIKAKIYELRAKRNIGTRKLDTK
ncbi:MAG: glycosyltransferase family 2 protein [Terriglobales bacterium]